MDHLGIYERGSIITLVFSGVTPPLAVALISKNGSAPVATVNVVTSLGSGLFSLTLAGTETNTLGTLVVKIADTPIIVLMVQIRDLVNREIHSVTKNIAENSINKPNSNMVDALRERLVRGLKDTQLEVLNVKQKVTKR